MSLVIFGIFLFGFIIGFYFHIVIKNIANRKVINDLNNRFEEVLDNINNGKSKFRTRISNVVYIQTNIKEHGDVDLVYIIDRPDISIFKGSKCLYTSSSIKKETINTIIASINQKHGRDINDIVNIYGFIINRKEFDRMLGDSNQKYGKMNIQTEKSDIEKIITDNKTKFDIDEILDKISSIGMDSLTVEEKAFLENYGNKS